MDGWISTLTNWVSFQFLDHSANHQKIVTQQNIMNDQQKQVRIERWKQYRGPAYRRWRVYSTFLTGFAIGLFYVLLVSGSWPSRGFLDTRVLVLIFSGILGGVIYTIVVDGHVEMPRFVAGKGDKFEAGLFGDILLGIAGAVVLDFIAQSLSPGKVLTENLEVAAAGIVGGYGGRAILQFALQRVFKDIDLLEADRQRYLQANLQANLQRRLERMDSLELVAQLNKQIESGLSVAELGRLTAEIKQAELGDRKRIYKLASEFRRKAKQLGEPAQVDRSIPIFEALVESEPQNHQYYAELAFAYKDSESSDWVQVIQYLDRAIALRGNEQRANTWNYELSRAITRIQAAYSTTGTYDFDPAVHERIIADLLSVAEIYNLENILKAASDEMLPLPVMNWMQHNQTMLAAHPKAKVLVRQLDTLVSEQSVSEQSTEPIPLEPNVSAASQNAGRRVISQTPVSPETVSSKTIPLAAINLIKVSEGYETKLPDGRAQAYADVIHGWDVPTIGYGTTRYPNGRRVQQGDIITKADAEKYLLAQLENDYGAELKKMPTWPQMNINQQGALYSFAYNLGAHFYRGQNFNSITKVCDSPSRWIDIAWVEAQFVKYRNPGSSAEAGLRKRRLAEAKLFCTPVASSHSTSLAEQVVDKNSLRGDKRLEILYFSQRDNAAQADRTCNTTSCWMGALYIKPELWEKSNRDKNGDLNYYLPIVNKYGDTTVQSVQTKALAELGVESEWRQTLTLEDVRREIDRDRPVVLGVLHRGHVSNVVRQGGHMILAVGYDETGLIIHDPYGDMDLVNGGYPVPDSTGAYLHYSDRNLRPRFEADGSRSGWGRLFQ